MPRRLVPALSPNSELWAFSLPLQTTPIPSEAELVPIAVPPCAAQEGSPMLTQDRHQYEMLRDEGSAYNELRRLARAGSSEPSRRANLRPPRASSGRATTFW